MQRPARLPAVISRRTLVRRAVRRWMAMRFADLLNRVPRNISRGFGRLSGWIAWRTSARERIAAEQRFSRVFGCSGADGQAAIRRTVLELGASLADAIRLETMSPSYLRRIVALSGGEALEAALNRGDGVIIVGGHVGNWELLAAAIADSGVPLSVVGRRPGDPVLAARLEQLRGRWGVDTLWRDLGPRPVIRALRNGRAVAMLIDQATDVAGAYVPFFGIPAWTPTGPARIAARFSVPVVGAHMTGDVDGGYVGVIEAFPCAGDGVTPVELTARWTGRIEDWIREAPHRWVWMHDRWKVMTERVPGGREEVTA